MIALEQTRPAPVLLPTPTDEEKARYAALEYVARVDEDLDLGSRHYWSKSAVFYSGEVHIFETLDEVVRAILEDDLLTPDDLAMWGAMAA